MYHYSGMQIISMVTIGRLNEKGDKLIMNVEEDAMSILYLVNLSDDRRTKLPTPFGTIGVIKFHPVSDLLALSMSTPQTPGDVFVIDLSDLSTTRWTESETGFLPIFTLDNCPRRFKYQLVCYAITNPLRNF